MVRAAQGSIVLSLLYANDRWNNEVHILTISEDDTGSLILAVNGIMTILTEEDEAALLQRLLDRAGGLQNLWVESVSTGNCSITESFVAPQA